MFFGRMRNVKYWRETWRLKCRVWFEFFGCGVVGEKNEKRR